MPFFLRKIHRSFLGEISFISAIMSLSTDSKEKLIIFDTTLRDGEQSPGVTLSISEKVEIAKQLSRLGVDVCEAGFPVASQGDFEAVQRIAREVGPLTEGRVQGKPMTICGLSRCVEGGAVLESF